MYHPWNSLGIQVRIPKDSLALYIGTLAYMPDESLGFPGIPWDSLGSDSRHLIADGDHYAVELPDYQLCSDQSCVHLFMVI